MNVLETLDYGNKQLQLKKNIIVIYPDKVIVNYSVNELSEFVYDVIETNTQNVNAEFNIITGTNITKEMLIQVWDMLDEKYFNNLLKKLIELKII